MLVEPLRLGTQGANIRGALPSLEMFMFFAPDKHTDPSPNPSSSQERHLQPDPIKSATRVCKQSSEGELAPEERRRKCCCHVGKGNRVPEQAGLPESLAPSGKTLSLQEGARTNGLQGAELSAASCRARTWPSTGREELEMR